VGEREYSLIFWAVCMVLWGQCVWGNWAGAVCQRYPPDSHVWYWLRLAKIERTRENCIRFIKGVCVTGMACLTAAVAAELIWGK
jgi:hypothetical protein